MPVALRLRPYVEDALPYARPRRGAWERSGSTGMATTDAQRLLHIPAWKLGSFMLNIF